MIISGKGSHGPGEVHLPGSHSRAVLLTRIRLLELIQEMAPELIRHLRHTVLGAFRSLLKLRDDRSLDLVAGALRDGHPGSFLNLLRRKGQVAGIFHDLLDDVRHHLVEIIRSEFNDAVVLPCSVKLSLIARRIE